MSIVLRAAVFLFIVFCFLVNFKLVPEIYAQSSNSSGIAVYIQVKDKKVQEGDIISLSKDGYILGRTAYDPNIFGVVVKEPAVAFESNISGSVPVVSDGKVWMRVSTINGNIKQGDLITTSNTSGVGQKSTQTGFVVASALENYSADSPGKIGKIMVVLNVGLRNATTGEGTSGNIANLSRVINIIRDPASLSPEMILRLFFAGLMVVLSFLVGVGYFGRISSLGIEALGRNPLARKTIVVGITLNLMLAFGVIVVGIAIGYLVLAI